MADAASCRMGAYSPHRDDPYAPGGGPARPCLAFFQGGTAWVALEERPVAARFAACGQINHLPGLWQPQWVPATLFVYARGSPLAGVVTVVFEDEGEAARHAIDLQRLPLGGGA